MMKRVFNLSDLAWRVAGFMPHVWRLDRSAEIGASPRAEVPAVPAPVPGSVQQALLAAGVLPDWDHGLNARLCEWVENRHWLYETRLPNDWFRGGTVHRLRCLGLDGAGLVRFNGREVLAFDNAYVPHTVDLTPYAGEKENVLQIVFECPPRWLGQFGYTARMTDRKPRFNYGWDWTPRLVQIGVWDGVFLDAVGAGEIEDVRAATDYDLELERGTLAVRGTVAGPVDGRVRAVLSRGDTILRREQVSLPEFEANGVDWRDLDVDPWWPNGLGTQALYTLALEGLDVDGHAFDLWEKKVGFKHVAWRACDGAPAGADPWVCEVNGRPVFLRGVNWTPVRPNHADVAAAEVRRRLELYSGLGMNVVRVWGGAVLGTEPFYDACDELGLLVWQEFPLSSSGVDNAPPDDARSLEVLEQTARSYVARRSRHVSLLLWCGGNELSIGGIPVTCDHPLIARFRDVVATDDPGRRFVPSSPTGPRFSASREDRGQGVHWNVHGPWKADGPLDQAWSDFWGHDDALFHAEVGAPGPSPAELIRRTRGNCEVMPCTTGNPLWRRFPWWTEWDEFLREYDREPRDLDEYVAWGQARQAEALRIVALSCKQRFPRCGGVIFWMGHDSYPCTANTSIVDYDGNLKPAAAAIGEVFRSEADCQRNGPASRPDPRSRP